MSLINLFVGLRSAFANWRNRQRAYDELTALDDRSLADIGIHRSQIPALVMSFEEAARLEASPVVGPATALSRSAGLAPGHR